MEEIIMKKKIWVLLTIVGLFLLTSQVNANDFIDNLDGTVTDLDSSLMWQQVDNGRLLNWDQANLYVNDLVLAGHDDWRLPTLDELFDLVDRNWYNPAININFFPTTKTAEFYWSSTIGTNGYADDVTFLHQGGKGQGGLFNVDFVRAVREDTSPGPGPGPDPVPEPSTIILLGIGLAGFSLLHKTRRR
jgi:hypothetical protein